MKLTKNGAIYDISNDVQKRAFLRSGWVEASEAPLPQKQKTTKDKTKVQAVANGENVDNGVQTPAE